MICKKLTLSFIPDGNGDLFNTCGPEDIFNYIYAILNSPTYRIRYAEFLKIDFPRLPLTCNPALFRDLCKLGKVLVDIHLLESQLLNDADQFGGVYLGNEPSGQIGKGYPKFENSNVYINPSERFSNVSEEVWEYYIGGYQPCQKWLKDRRARQLSSEDIAHYQKIVRAIGRTIEIIGEIDEVIDAACGWPIQ